MSDGITSGIPSIDKRLQNNKSVLNCSLLYGYLDNKSPNAIKDRKKAFECAVEAFRKEAVSVLRVMPAGVVNVATRYETVKSIIFKTLLYIGLTPTDMSFVIAARIIEIWVRNTNKQIGEVIDDISKTTGAASKNLIRAGESSIDIFDKECLARIRFLTDSNPETALEALHSIALYIRIMLTDEARNAQYF